MSRSCRAPRAGSIARVQCLAGPGDEVIVPEPIYATYEGVIGASGARMVTVPLRRRDRVPPRSRRARRRGDAAHPGHLDQHARTTRPARCSPRPRSRRIAALCRRHDLWLLSDEVYEDLAFARPHVSAWSLPEMAERTVVVSSLSKSHAIPAFRLGWVVGPPALIRHLSNLLLSMTYGSPAFIQDGALAALTRRTARGRRACARITGARAGADVGAAARGAGLPRRAARRRHVRAARRARHRARRRRVCPPAARRARRVAVLPCDGFGPSAAGHLRIALSAPEARLAKPGERIVRFARALAAER